MAHETKACVLAQASASVLAMTLSGADRARIERLYEEIRALLQTQDAMPSAPFGGFAAFNGAVEYASRHRCVLLPVEAVMNALGAAQKS